MHMRSTLNIPMFLCVALLDACLGDVNEGAVAEGKTALETPDPSQISITATATGCGGYDTQISSDNRLFAVTFDGARGGRDATGSQEIACEVTFTYRFPAGYTFDAPSLMVRGFAIAEGSSSVTIHASESLADTQRASTTIANANDPFEVALPGGGQAGSAPCGATSATVTVRIASAMSGSGAVGVGVDWIDGTISWRRCT